MFTKLMDELAEQRKKFIDDLTKNLMELAGFSLPENPSEFEILMTAHDMQKEGYIIRKDTSTTGNDMIALYKRGDLCEDLIGGYELDVKIEGLSLKIKAVPIN